jgi:alkylation response protein AidB-like acyl-CoA dehydrogenase
MTQHQSAVSLLAKSDNGSLKERLLPHMDDAIRIGIGISQLRRGGPPMVTAEPVEGGYVVNGAVPWVTGAGFFHHFVVGARLPDRRALFGIVPFSPWMEQGPEARLARTEQIGGHTQALESGGEITFSPPMQLAAMMAANTVSLELRDVFLTEEAVVFIKPADWPERNDMVNIVLQGHFALGCAQAGIDVARQAFASKQRASIAEAADQLQAKLDRLRQAAAQIPADLDSETTDEKLQIRAQAIALAFACAQAAIVASSGAANLLDHPAQRIHREALVFAVSAQTPAIMDATLQKITAILE